MIMGIRILKYGVARLDRLGYKNKYETTLGSRIEQARGSRKTSEDGIVANGFFLCQAQKFITAYAAFLKRQGKLPIPGMYFAPVQHNDVPANTAQVGLIPSRLVLPASSLPRTLTGSTSAPPLSPATSTSARPLVSAVSARSTVPPRTAVLPPATTSMPPAPSTARSSRPSRRLVSSSRMRRRAAAASPRPVSVIWTVLPRPPLRPTRRMRMTSKF